MWRTGVLSIGRQEKLWPHQIFSLRHVTMWLSAERLTKRVMCIQCEEQEVEEVTILFPADISMYKAEKVVMTNGAG